DARPDRCGPGLREGDLHARIPRRRRLDHRAGRTARGAPRLGLGNAAQALRAWPRRARALPRSPPHGARPPGRARGDPPPPARRAAALRRAAIRPRRPQDPCARIGARERDARGGGVTTVETLSVEAREAGITPLEALLRRGRLRATLMMLGPAFVASIAYVDPG